jgi:hypothetical protein
MFIPAAAEVLAAHHPFVKTRPLHEATNESRMKARRSAEFLQPYRVRPETCAALARRLVTGALGVRLNTTREEREAERKILNEARGNVCFEILMVVKMLMLVFWTVTSVVDSPEDGRSMFL